MDPTRIPGLEAVRRPLDHASGLPPACYTDPAFFAAERERLFLREWLPVGREEDVPAPGDYVCTDRFGEPLVVVRDAEGVLHALSRVCRHRGMPVVEGRGRRRSFQCPYHLWTYGLDGRLLGAPEMERAAGFDRDACRLPSLRLECWEGWIFVNFDPGAAPLGAALEPLRRRLAPWRLGAMRTAATLAYDSPWNWKVMVENFLESYHHVGPHRDTLQPLFPAAGTFAEDVEGPYAVLQNPAQEAGAPPLVVCGVFPLHLFAPGPDQCVAYELDVDAHDHFRLDIRLLLPEEHAGDPGPVEALRDFVDLIHRQDVEVCRGVQRGLASPRAQQGRLSHLEKAIWQFDRWVLDRVDPRSP